MRLESTGPPLANMSAPPRSIVMLPRLTLAAVAPDIVSEGSTPAAAQGHQTTREVQVGPGGGRLLSSALHMARVQLPTALCAYLRMPYAAPLLTAHLGLARALVAVSRQWRTTPPARGAGRAARLELDRVAALPEGDLVQELAARLDSVRWPDWVPQVGFATPLGNDIGVGVGIDRKRPPDPPDPTKGVDCPLLAARLISAIRGPVFLRDAAPALSNLLNLWGGATPSGTWEIWLPVAPGTVRPLLCEDSTRNNKP